MVRIPDDEDQLRDALNQGILQETHTLDFKSALPKGAKENKELARDLAQFAIDGGVLAIGIDDNDKTKPPTLTPVDLNGLRERIDQVAQSIPEPPLHVRIETIPTRADRTNGYLFVVVPPCPDGPRMVDGRYLGRGDTTRHTMPAQDVARHYEWVARAQRSADELLDSEMHRHLDGVGRIHSHLFGVAQPVLGPPDLLQRVVGTDGIQGWEQFLHSQVRGSMAGRPLKPAWSPDLPRAIHVSRRAKGWALSSLPMRGREVAQTGQQEIDLEKRALDLEIGEDGGLRLFCGGASDSLTGYSGDQPEEFVMVPVIVGLTKRLILVANTVADVTGFVGSWDLGIGVTDLRGRNSHRMRQAFQDWEDVPFSDDNYRQTARVTYERLMRDPDGILEDLVGQLGRALSTTIEISQ